MMVGLLVVPGLSMSGCQQKQGLPVDTEPILPPSRQAPADAAENLYGQNFLPAEPPEGQMYLPDQAIKDVNDTPFKESIDRLVRKRLVPVSRDGWFQPKRYLTRGEALLWLFNLYLSAKPEGAAPMAPGGQNSPAGAEGDSGRAFDGLPGAGGETAQPPIPQATAEGEPWFSALSRRIQNREILQSYPELILAPDKPIQREELAALIWIFSNAAKGLQQEVNQSKDALDNPNGHTAQGIIQALKKSYAGSIQDVSPEFLLGVQYLIAHKHGDLYRQVFLHDEMSGQMRLEPQRQVRRDEAAALLDGVESDFREQVFINRSRSGELNPGNQTPHSSEGQSEPEDSPDPEADQ